MGEIWVECRRVARLTLSIIGDTLDVKWRIVYVCSMAVHEYRSEGVLRKAGACVVEVEQKKTFGVLAIPRLQRTFRCTLSVPFPLYVNVPVKMPCETLARMQSTECRCFFPMPYGPQGFKLILFNFMITCSPFQFIVWFMRSTNGRDDS